jgi:DNA-binding LacI/PurR family transcriptional regulator
VRHLAELGHRRCVFVSGPRRSWSNQQRQQGLRAAARTHDIEYEILGPVAPQFQSGVQTAEQVLETGATAVLAYNDLVAVGILSRLAELGVRVPDQLSVVGFDDIPLAAMVIPPLTTVSLPTMRAGEAAIDVLLERLQSRGSVQATPRKLPATLIVRSTTAPPARRTKGTARRNGRAT